MPAIGHRSHKGLNNRAEPPASATTRAGDAGLSISGRPWFVAVFSAVRNLFVPTPFPSLRPCHPSSSPQRRGAMEGRGRHRRLSPFVQRRSLPRAPWSVNVMVRTMPAPASGSRTSCAKMVVVEQPIYRSARSAFVTSRICSLSAGSRSLTRRSAADRCAPAQAPP